MKSLRERIKDLLIGFGALVVLASCSMQSEPIKIGISAWAGVEPAELAARKGFYVQRGVAVKMVRFSAYTDSLKAFREGRVDADMHTLDDAIRLASSGKKLKIVLFTDYSYGGDGVVAKNPIATVEELKGKKVGVEIGTVGHLSLLKALETAGLSEDDITIVSIAAWEIKEAFMKGEIDAGVTWEPYLTSSAEEGDGKVIITSRDYPKTIVTCMVASSELVEKRPKDLEKIVMAYFDAVSFLKENPEEAFRIMGEAEGVSGEEFADHVQGLVYFGLDQNRNAFGESGNGELYEIGEQIATFLLTTGVIDTPVRMTDIMDGRFIYNPIDEK
jgi:NitT/TauT family transport system substrate-binding protein